METDKDMDIKLYHIINQEKEEELTKENFQKGMETVYKAVKMIAAKYCEEKGINSVDYDDVGLLEYTSRLFNVPIPSDEAVRKLLADFPIYHHTRTVLADSQSTVVRAKTGETAENDEELMDRDAIVASQDGNDDLTQF